MFDFSILHNDGTAFAIFSYSGKGVPLHKLDKAQTPWIKLLRLWVLLIKWTTESTHPASISLSLNAGESPARLPTAQIAWSAIPGLFYIRNEMRIGMTLYSMREQTSSGPPVAMFETIHVASNFRWGYMFCFIHSTITGNMLC